MTHGTITTMPTVHRDKGFRFAIASNDCPEPPHVHATRGRESAKYWLDPVALARRVGLSRSELGSVKSIVVAQRQKLLGAWQTFCAGIGPVIRRQPLPVGALRATVRDDRLVVDLTDGRTVAVSLAQFPRLVQASDSERRHYELIADGTLIHWPDIDEDIDVPNLLPPPPR